MDSAQAQNGGGGGRLSAWRRRKAAQIVAGFGASIAAILSLAYASYTLSRPDEVPLAKPGEAIEAGRWRVALIEARFAKANLHGNFFLDQRDSLQVDMRFTNLSQESSNSYPRVVQFDPVADALGEPVFKLTRDNSIAGSLHPDMPEYVTAYWTLPEGSPPPRELTFRINGEYFKPRDNLYAAPGWFPADQAARLTLPVKIQP